ncbi:hypothetical protein Krac_6030 [Ktedonobacter racemifer DSM 44963]|uniref:Uncharacterized protein n=1 Tax=Ktedonobacter racemifer DSM 44963 TaxID=485913 RepID=D6TXH8_KTERA|nr:hypothetical protein Krac_6030 [Ktedonobacter racemifer DSM 44963]
MRTTRPASSVLKNPPKREEQNHPIVGEVLVNKVTSDQVLGRRVSNRREE